MKTITRKAPVPVGRIGLEEKRTSSIRSTSEKEAPVPFPLGMSSTGDNQAIVIQKRLHDGQIQRAQRQDMAVQIGQAQGNRYIQQLMIPEINGDRTEVIQKEDGDAEEVDENAPSTEAPGLTVGVVTQINDLIRQRKRRDALNLLVEHLGSTGEIDLDLLTDRKMYYDAGLSGEGVAPPPGFRRDPVTNQWVARPTPVRIGPDAFRQGVSWLYSSVMHEYQHVLQFQENVARGTMGQRSLGWLIERQEVEAYATEIINSEQTGLNQHPRQMRETWRRLHTDHWLALGRSSRRLLNDLYTQAHDIAQEVVGERVRLPFRPAS